MARALSSSRRATSASRLSLMSLQSIATCAAAQPGPQRRALRRTLQSRAAAAAEWCVRCLAFATDSISPQGLTSCPTDGLSDGSSECVGAFRSLPALSLTPHRPSVRARALRRVRSGLHDRSGRVRRRLRGWPLRRPCVESILPLELTLRSVVRAGLRADRRSSGLHALNAPDGPRPPPSASTPLLLVLITAPRTLYACAMPICQKPRSSPPRSLTTHTRFTFSSTPRPPGLSCALPRSSYSYCSGHLYLIDTDSPAALDLLGPARRARRACSRSFAADTARDFARISRVLLPSA